MSDQQQGTGAGGILVAFALGAAVGAAIALLTAPATGRETREIMSRRTREGREKMLDALRQGRGILDAQRENVVTAFERARQQAQQAAGPREGDQEA